MRSILALLGLLLTAPTYAGDMFPVDELDGISPLTCENPAKIRDYAADYKAAWLKIQNDGQVGVNPNGPVAPKGCSFFNNDFLWVLETFDWGEVRKPNGTIIHMFVLRARTTKHLERGDTTDYFVFYTKELTVEQDA